MLGRTTLFLQLAVLFFVGICFLNFAPPAHAQTSAVVIATVQIIPPEPPTPILDSMAPVYLGDILKTENTSNPDRDEALSSYILPHKDKSLICKTVVTNNLSTAGINSASP
jgi:hypothetical protein